ncbi:MAG: MJ0042-type zinc finger domain-containing protein [Candidatus Thorarchaeota archaeon]
MCPHCRAAYRYTDEKIRENGTVICQDCAKVFSLQTEREVCTSWPYFFTLAETRIRVARTPLRI